MRLMRRGRPARSTASDIQSRRSPAFSAGEPVAVVSGTATLPSSAKAVNAGNVKRVAFVRDDTVVYALKAPGGTVMLFR